MKNKDGFHVTPWFPGEEKPVRKGFYERKFWYRTFYAYWNGNRFCFGCETLKEAVARKKSSAHVYQHVPWRGITKKQYKKAKKANQ